MRMEQLHHQLLVDEFKLLEIGFSGNRIAASGRLDGPEDQVGYASGSRHHHDDSVFKRGVAHNLRALPEAVGVAN